MAFPACLSLKLYAQSWPLWYYEAADGASCPCSGVDAASGLLSLWGPGAGSRAELYSLALSFFFFF